MLMLPLLIWRKVPPMYRFYLNKKLSKFGATAVSSSTAKTPAGIRPNDDPFATQSVCW